MNKYRLNFNGHSRTVHAQDELSAVMRCGLGQPASIELIGENKMNAFVRFSCGCIGFPIDAKRAVIIKACDVPPDGHRISWFERDMDGKDYEYLSDEESGKIHGQLNQLIFDGNQFQELRRILNQ
jgi:hypothetical protein